MSQENVELLCQGFDVWNRRDLDTALAGSHPDVEITPVMGPAATTYRGHEGMRRFWDDIIGTFPDFSTEVVEARDLGDFVLGRVRISGKEQAAKCRLSRRSGMRASGVTASCSVSRL